MTASAIGPSTNLITRPKLELHLHLEGAARPEFIRSLAQKKRRSVAGIFAPDGGYQWTDFTEFLAVYERATSLLETPEDYYALTLDVLAQQARGGVVYSEIFVAPSLMGNNDAARWSDFMSACEQAAMEAEARYGTVARFIAVAVRHFGGEAAMQAAKIVVGRESDCLVGFGLAGDERQYQARDFCHAFDLARAAGLGITAHAGEFGGPNSVRDVLEHLRPSRIGHGVRAIESPELVRELADRQIILEMCPISNIALKLYENHTGHPIPQFWDAGVKLTISTDDPPFFNSSMPKEYHRLTQNFGWGDTEFDQLDQTALAGRFCKKKDFFSIIKLFNRLQQLN